MAEIRVPTLGESVTEATIGKWFKKAGEPVAADEPLVELETDKVTIEVPAPAAGVLSEITAKDGETVAVGALLGQIKEGAGAAPQQDHAGAAGRPDQKTATTAPINAAEAAEPSAAARRTCRCRRRCAASRPRPAWTPRRSPAPARTAASPRATCWLRSSAPPRRRPRSRSRPQPFRSARRRRPTMPRAKSA